MLTDSKISSHPSHPSHFPKLHTHHTTYIQIPNLQTQSHQSLIPLTHFCTLFPYPSLAYSGAHQPSSRISARACKYNHMIQHHSLLSLSSHSIFPPHHSPTNLASNPHRALNSISKLQRSAPRSKRAHMAYSSPPLVQCSISSII